MCISKFLVDFNSHVPFEFFLEWFWHQIYKFLNKSVDDKSLVFLGDGAMCIQIRCCHVQCNFARVSFWDSYQSYFRSNYWRKSLANSCWQFKFWIWCATQKLCKYYYLYCSFGVDEGIFTVFVFTLSLRSSYYFVIYLLNYAWDAWLEVRSNQWLILFKQITQLYFSFILKQTLEIFATGDHLYALIKFYYFSLVSLLGNQAYEALRHPIHPFELNKLSSCLVDDKA